MPAICREHVGLGAGVVVVVGHPVAVVVVTGSGAVVVDTCVVGVVVG